MTSVYAPNSVGSPEEICNLALDANGYPESIADIYEGTKAARVAVRLYAQTRDAVMRAKDWAFAQRDAAATTNGLSAPVGWLYEYAYPPDCLRLRQVVPNGVGAWPILDPQDVLFTEYNETRTIPATKAILCNTLAPTLIYTGQITDMTTWDADFVEALVAALARRFAIALRDAPGLVPGAEDLSESAVEAALASQVNVPPAPGVMRERRAK